MNRADRKHDAPEAEAAGVPLRVLVAIALSITLLTLNATLLVVNAAATMKSHAEYARAYEIKRALNTFQSVLTAAESGQRGYLLTGQTGYLEPYYRAMRGWRREIERLRSLTADNPQRQADIAEVETLTAAAIHRLEQTIERSPHPGPSGGADVAASDRASISMDRVRGIVERMTAEEDARIAALGRELLRDLWVALGVALLATIVTVAVLIGLNRLLQRYGRERAGAERALLKTNQDLNDLVEQRTAELRELSQHLIRVSEEEKASLARELHDTLGSNLTAINMDLNWLQRRMPAESSREVRERLQRIIQLLGETVELKHEVIEGLRPSLLDNLGLAFAVQSHCKEFTRRTGIPCELDVIEDFDDLDPSWSIALYRIVQESLTNISKHAQATRVQVELARIPDGVRLRITDDGVGVLEEDLSKPKSHGLIGMRERMRQVGGRLTISRPPQGRGTLVEAFIPALAEAGAGAENRPGDVGKVLPVAG